MKEGEPSHNPCKAKGCNACCQNVRLDMTLEELAIFSQNYRESGKKLNRMLRKDSVEKRGMDLPPFFLKTVLWYAANQPLDKYLDTGRHSLTRAVVLVEGVCPNNKNGECAIYENRPSPCRHLEVEDENCRYCQNEINSAPNFIPLSEIDIMHPHVEIEQASRI